MRQRILITGCTGYIGRHLVAHLSEAAPEAALHGLSRSLPNPGLLRRLESHHQADLLDQQAVGDVISSLRPQAVIHLAAQKNGAWSALAAGQVVATTNLLDAVRQLLGPDIRVVVVGSSAEVGFCPPDTLPVAETAVCRPVSSYGVSKLAQSAQAWAAYLNFRQNVVRLRLFNVIGPDLPDSLLPGRAVRLLAAGLRSSQPLHLRFGDLSTSRDYTDVADVCRALCRGIERGSAGQLFHIGTGREVTGRELIQALIHNCPRPLPPVELLEEADGFAEGVSRQAADSALAREELGWAPRYSLAESVERMWSAVLEEVCATRPSA